eukprot:756079-Pelagomonas_calceolata.AAC.7
MNTVLYQSEGLGRLACFARKKKEREEKRKNERKKETAPLGYICTNAAILHYSIVLNSNSTLSMLISLRALRPPALTLP